MSGSTQIPASDSMCGRLLGVIAAAVLVAGCGLVTPPVVSLRPDQLDTDPRPVDPVMGGVDPIGPVIEVVRGSDGGTPGAAEDAERPSG